MISIRPIIEPKDTRSDRSLEAAQAAALRRADELREQGEPCKPRVTTPWRRTPISDEEVPF